MRMGIVASLDPAEPNTTSSESVMELATKAHAAQTSVDAEISPKSFRVWKNWYSTSLSASGRWTDGGRVGYGEHSPPAGTLRQNSADDGYSLDVTSFAVASFAFFSVVVTSFTIGCFVATSAVFTMVGCSADRPFAPFQEDDLGSHVGTFR